MEDAYKAAVIELKKKSHFGGPDYEVVTDYAWKERLLFYMSRSHVMLIMLNYYYYFYF